MAEQQIEVRNLSGESITISISPTKTVADLKLILKQRFLPSSSSSFDFHLFLRGKKLGVQSHVGSHTINSGEFIALMPFTKKEKPQNLQPEESGVPVQTTQDSAPSNLAESAWREMVEDLSYLSNNITSEEQPSCSTSGWSDKNKGDMAGNSGRKRRKKSQDESNTGLAEDLVSSLLHSSGKHVLDENVCENILKVLESVHCLSEAGTGNCMLLSMVNMQENGHMPSYSCLCPTWLTTMMKTFTFLNILAGYLQMRREIVTLDLVKDFLGKLRGLGFCATVDDLKHLPDLFPKVVKFIDQEAESSRLSLDVIVINNSTEKTDQHKSYVKARKSIPVLKIFSSIKRRQTLFRTTLQESLRLFVPHGNYEKIITLEQFITLLRKSDPFLSGTAAANCSSSIEAQCCETHPLSPTSMLDHLKKGFGSAGQIVHVKEVNARIADFREIPDELSENANCALKKLGIAKLYSHQAESIRASMCGKNVVVSTMTSSGKSLCYNLPVLEALSQHQLSCALYLFPTKALAQDQLRALLSMTEDFEHLNVGVYDGDTSQEKRNWLRDNARVVLH